MYEQEIIKKSNPGFPKPWTSFTLRSPTAPLLPKYAPALPTSKAYRRSKNPKEAAWWNLTFSRFDVSNLVSIPKISAIKETW